MELATGGDLFSLLCRKQGLNEMETRWVMRQLLQAVRYLHEKGVAHRDIKPENVLCALSPNIGPNILLADLGLAAVLSHGRLKSDVGTDPYQAP